MSRFGLIIHPQKKRKMTTLQSRFWYTSKWFAAVFISLFIFRLLYGYVAIDKVSSYEEVSDYFSHLGEVRKNYASEKFKMKQEVQTASTQASNQKFEKTASIKSKSSEFEKDDKEIKARTKDFNAVIQYEQNLGQKGERQIHLLIGVNPILFDSFYVEMQKIGVLKATQITKVDKTNEYKQLNAKKTSLEKTLESLKELKTKGGQIADCILLNDKILATEEQLQGLGVELGNFDAENEFCSVRLSLYEGATEKNISVMHRVKVALEWTIKYFSLLVCTLLGLLVVIYTLLKVIDQLKLIKAVANKLGE